MTDARGPGKGASAAGVGESNPRRRDRSIPRRPPGAESVLSFAQQRLWFLAQLEPDRPTYNVPLALRLHGELERAALAAALTAIVARHEVLRTTFTARNGLPVQVVREPSSPVRMREVDLSGLGTEERASTLQRQMREQTNIPFDLARDEMLRATLFRLDQDLHVLLLSLHHIATDGWSMGVLVQELADFYNGFGSDHRPAPPPLPIQYADYAQWQRERLQGEVLEEQLAYWRGKLAGAPTVLQLPMDRPRPAIQGWQGSTERVALPRLLTDALKTLGRRQEVTLFMTLLAALQTLLHRYTGEDDILVGAPIAGRTQVKTEPLIGFFANTLVLRTSLAGDPPFRELLRRVRDVCLEAYAHQELPFERLVEELHPERNRSHSPLIQTVLVLQNTPEVAPTFAGLTMSRLPVDAGVSKFDLLLDLTETAGELVGDLRYDTALFDAATIARIGEHFRTLLEGIIADPDRPLSRLPLLTDAERHELLVGWNRTEREYPREACVHGLFAAQAARTPEAVAVVSEEGTLTYRQLDARANQLARRLQREGVGSETPVAIYVERSLDMVVGVLGILKAGGAYVPLDAAAPPERLAFMVKDVGAAAILTQAPLVARLPDRPARLILVDSEAPAIAREPDDPPPHGARADSIAYVMYTSGSTGRPKGVSVPHRAIVRLVQGTTYVRWSADEAFLLLAPLAFDATTFEIWGSLLHGARLVIPPARQLSLPELGDLLLRSGVTTLWLTAGLFHQLVDHQLPSLRGIRQLLTGGDVVSAAHVRRLLEAHPECTLINGYGPTEGTTFTCCHRVTDAGSIAVGVPIGRPIANTRVYILDRHREPTPVGVAGELHIAGDGLARGYLDQPELTADRFVVRALGPRSAERLYRTGDLARYRPDGIVEFLGRLDDQVKIRGYRVEPGEIEAALGSDPSVRNVVVAARGEPGDRQLVAYVVTAPELGLDTAALQSHLRRRLPEYMVPADFVALDALPLTPNGKVDRQALPPPAAVVPTVGHELPLTSGERRVLEIWCRLLRRNRVGLDDNFFDVGGHSLLATQLLSRIEQAFDTRLALATLFEAPTIRQQAVLLQERQPVPASRFVPIQAAGSRPPLFFIDAFPLFRALASRLGPDQPFLGLRHPEVTTLSHPFSLDEIAAYHVTTIRTVRPEGPYLIGGWSAGGTVAYEVARQLQAAGGEVALVAMFEASPPGFGRYPLSDRFVSLGRRLRFHSKSLARLDPREMPWYAAARLQTIGRALRARAWRRSYRTALGLGGTLSERFQSIDQVVLFALSTYQPRLYPGHVVFFRSAERLEAFRSELDFGWGKFATGGIEVHVIPGDHISMFDEPNVAEIVARLTPHLERAVAD